MPEIVQPDPTQPGFTGDAAEGLCHGIGPYRTSVWVGEHEGLRSYVHPQRPGIVFLSRLSGPQDLATIRQ